MKRYVLGFAFSPDGRCVLIEKQSQDWQNGLVNGLGGSIENGEDPNSAMRREFLEECGIKTDVNNWRYGLTIYGSNADKPVGDDWELIVFRGEVSGQEKLSQCNEGRVFWADSPPENMERTALWLYWFCRDASTFGLNIDRRTPHNTRI